MDLTRDASTTREHAVGGILERLTVGWKRFRGPVLARVRIAEPSGGIGLERRRNESPD